jgi:hypothetical protein
MCIIKYYHKQGIGNNKSKKTTKQERLKEAERLVLIKRSAALGLFVIGVVVSLVYQKNMLLYGSVVLAGSVLFLIENRFI